MSEGKFIFFYYSDRHLFFLHAGFINDDSSKYEAAGDRIPRIEFHALNTEGNHHSKGGVKSRGEKLNNKSRNNESNRIKDKKPKLEIQDSAAAVDKNKIPRHTSSKIELNVVESQNEEASSANYGSSLKEEDSNIQEDEEWTFASSFLYSLSLITTMGKGLS